MTTLAADVPIRLTTASPRWRSARLPVDLLVARVGMWLRRPTTALPLTWDRQTTIRARVVVDVDGTEHACETEMTGGIRVTKDPLQRFNDREEPASGILYDTPVRLGRKGPAVMRSSPRDRRGFWKRIPLTRLAEEALSAHAWVELELIDGPAVDLHLILADAIEALPPADQEHNSVAYDSASSAQELNGDGVLSLTHTSTGANRGVCGSAKWDTNGSGDGSASITYGGGGLTEDLEDASTTNDQSQIALYHGVAQATGAQTVTSTLVAFEPLRHFLGVISMTGVHQTVPVGAPVFAEGTDGNAIATVAGVGADDLVVDGIGFASPGSPSVGADQTQRLTQNEGSNYFRMSTQPGSAGGVMTWTAAGEDYHLQLAIAFKPAVSDLTLEPTGSQSAAQSSTALVAARLLPAGSQATSQQSSPSLLDRLLPSGTQLAGQSGTPLVVSVYNALRTIRLRWP